jgi:hypothetical protein
MPATDRRTRRSPDQRAYGRTFHAAIDGGLIGIATADLHAGKLPAFTVIETELIEILAGAGQHHHTGTGWHGRARG